MTITPAAAKRGASSFDDVAPEENGDVETGRVGGRRILDRDLTVAPRECRPGRTSRGEEPQLADREVPLRQEGADYAADLSRGTHDTDSHTVAQTVARPHTLSAGAWPTGGKCCSSGSRERCGQSAVGARATNHQWWGLMPSNVRFVTPSRRTGRREGPWKTSTSVRCTPVSAEVLQHRRWGQAIGLPAQSGADPPAGEHGAEALAPSTACE